MVAMDGKLSGNYHSNKWDKILYTVGFLVLLTSGGVNDETHSGQYCIVTKASTVAVPHGLCGARKWCNHTTMYCSAKVSVANREVSGVTVSWLPFPK